MIVLQVYISEVNSCNSNAVENLAVRGDKYDDDIHDLEGRLKEALTELRKQVTNHLSPSINP